MRKKLCVDEVTGAIVKRAVHGDNVALGDEILEILDAASTYVCRSFFGKWCVVVVKKLLAVEWPETLKDAVADAARANRADDLALELS